MCVWVIFLLFVVLDVYKFYFLVDVVVCMFFYARCTFFVFDDILSKNCI